MRVRDAKNHTLLARAVSARYDVAMNVQPITIPQKIASRGDLVLIPRSEYEELLELRNHKEFIPTSAQKRALAQAENNLKKGKTLSYYELVKALGATR